MIALIVVAVVAASRIPILPGGPDVYAHLLWTHQVMRCLKNGELPLWAPDLNAGFGAPGIRLYSPAGPCLSGIFGLMEGSAAAGLWSSLVLAAAAILLLAARGRGGALAGLIVLAGTPFLGDLIVRTAWSQMLAVPLAWWLLERVADEDRPLPAPVPAALAMGALWLVHAPTALMVGLLVALGVLLRLGPRAALRWGVPWGLVAAGLTAWHWLPLANELPLTAAHRGLTGGIFQIDANWLGSAHAHMAGLNVAYSAAGVVLAALLLILPREVRDGARPIRTVLVLVALALSTALVVPIVRAGVPLDWLQFPWRWLTPAALLLARPVAVAVRRRPVLAVVWLAPLVLLPRVAPVAPPPLGAEAGWPAVGQAVASFGGNPFAVDVIEHRPPWYPGLAQEIARFGEGRRVMVEGEGRAAVREWRPLERTVEVVAGGPALLRLRLLRYPWWRLELDGREVSGTGEGTVVAVRVPAGRHGLRCRWGGNPMARAGQALAAVTVLFLAWRRRRETPVPPAAPFRVFGRGSLDG